MHRLSFLGVVASLLIATAMPAQHPPSVSFVAPGSVAVKAGGSVKVPLVFHVPSGFKVGAGGDETFIPAELHLSAPAGVAVTTKFPKSIAQRFATHEKPVFLYNGDVTVQTTITVPKTASPGTMTITGNFKYQLFDSRSARAPDTVPVTFTVQVNGGERAKRRH